VVIDANAGKVVTRIPVGKRPRGLKVSADGKLLYVALSGTPRGGPGVDEANLPPADRAADGTTGRPGTRPVSRSPEETRSMISSLQHGWQRGRVDDVDHPGDEPAGWPGDTPGGVDGSGGRDI